MTFTVTIRFVCYAWEHNAGAMNGVVNNGAFKELRCETIR